MKKIIASILAFSCFTGFGGELWAAANCGVKMMKLSGAQHIYDDEFLYENQQTFDKVVDKNGEYTGLPGNVYECDNEFCNDGQEVFMKAGHIFKGDVVKEDKTYVCKAAWGVGDDRWVEKGFGNVCGEVHVSFDGNQRPEDNEFLFSTHAAYKEAQRKRRNDSVDLSGVGIVYECDNDHCHKGTVQTMPKGHAFGGKYIDETVTYECKTNRWMRVGAESCLFAGTNIGIDQWYTDSLGVKIQVSYNDCHQVVDGSPADINNKFWLKCERVNGLLRNVCYKVSDENDDKKPDDKVAECAEYISDFNLFQQCSFCNREKESGAFWDSKSKICRCIGEANKDKEWNAEQGKCVAKVNDNDLQKCLNSRTTAEGRACCYLPESVAKFENGKCVCAGGKAFRIDMNGRGICTGGNNGEGQDIIPPATCMSLVSSLMTKVTTECASVLANVTVLSSMCTNGQLTWSYWNQQSLDINIKCEDDKARRDQEEVNKQAKQKLIAAGEKLDSIIAGFEKSRWKNAEGEFNTARLASDSIAGVVLGTTGGLVTSSVMKKKQVEQGFEDLQCVVGGQTVAGWGDEFVVGIQ